MHSLLAELLLVALSAGVAYAAYAGPYVLSVDAFVPCEGRNADQRMSFFATFTPLNKKNSSELQRMSGKLTVLNDHGPDDTFWGHGQMDLRRGREWRESVISANLLRACSAIRENFPDFFRVLFGQTAMTGSCVIRGKWAYVVQDEPVNWTFPKIPVLPYGHWRYTFKMGKGAETHLCTKAVMHTTPKGPPRA